MFHNTLICMNQHGAFAEDESEEGRLYAIVRELYDLEADNENIARQEQRQHSDEMESNMKASGFDWEALEIREQYMNSSSAFKALQEDLVEAVKATRYVDLDS
ncbi:unnamed protein product [Agarophyton chilense]|eukprot:gb/GEZJ01008819.1/.p3 GENE.gb/GEZJ01008819.1/~~gb/GEZJ01008819.1/.p3  ORF type:complete len:103 (-),score=20.41 gb/GEZJ01008819.1/:363-671(-)